MKTKTILIALAFIVLLVIIVVVRQAGEGTVKLHHHDFYEFKEDWKDYTLENLKPHKKKQFLVTEEESMPTKLESVVYPTLYDFDEIIMSFNMMVEPGGGLLAVLSLSPDSVTWHDFHYQVWGDIDPDTLELSELPTRIEDVGYLDKDIIRLSQPMNYYKYTMYMFPGEPDGYVTFKRAVVCYTKTEASMREYKKYGPASRDLQPVVLSVPFRSQKSLPDSISGRTCSPSSITMVLNHHYRDYSLLEVSEMMYDKRNDIYGNWLYNVQGAYMLGLSKSWVGRHNSFGELVAEILDGKPVVISIAVQGERVLTGAPYEKTDGHLIVVRGFDEDGNVLVNDPAAANPHEGVTTYNINELTDVWINHEGVAYHLWPPE